MRNTTANAWATPNGIEPQRTDLWRIDLSQPAAALTRLLGAQHSITPQEADECVASISFPMQELASGQFMAGSTATVMPGSAKALDVVRLDVLMDRGMARNSRIWSFFVNWRNLSRLGREGQGRFALPLPDSSSVITNAFDVTVRLDGGAEPADTDLVSFAATSAGSAASATLELAAQLFRAATGQSPQTTTRNGGASYTLAGAWVKGLQHNTIDRSAAANVHAFSVLLHVNQIKT